MKLYGGIDLHSNNSMVVLLDEQDKVVYGKRHPNELNGILSALEPYRANISGLAVESTFNWYWLVDGLMEAGYLVSLVNTTAVQSYSGLKYSDDNHDARWLAHLLRLGILPAGYIYPKEERAVRDLLRKRSQLVRQSSSNLLSFQNLVARNTGKTFHSNAIKRLTVEQANCLLPNADQSLALKCNLAIMQSCQTHANELERVVRQRVKLRPEFECLLSVPGIGDILGLTIMLESGDINRFAKAGHFLSYARCVNSKKMSNGKKKGENNRKNGNRYLAWAFVEAANFAIRYNSTIKKYYQRKAAKTKRVIAIKAVSHKLARACYYLMRDQVPFDVNKAFG